MDASPLGGLPAEIRNNIYDLVLLSEDPIQVTCEAAATPGAPRRYKFLPGLLATCKQICSESEQIFFKRNTFNVNIAPRPAKIDFRPYCDEAHALWAFLNGLKRSRFPTPKHITLRISRSFGRISARDSQYFNGAETCHQLNEIEKFTIGWRIEKVECVIESSWGFTATPEIANIDMRNVRGSIRAAFDAFEEKYENGWVSCQAETVLASFHWKVLRCLNDTCEAREQKRIAAQKMSAK
ncbi:hypothetical protein BST61_g2368 [Cercospora zeina]